MIPTLALYAGAATAVLASLAWMALIFVVGRWAHRAHGMVSGYWICAWQIWAAAWGLLSPQLTARIVDDHLVHADLPWTMGNIFGAANYVGVALSGLQHLLLALLVCTELVVVLSLKDDWLPGLLAWIRRQFDRRRQLGILALILTMLYPLAQLCVLLVLEMGD